MNPVKYLTKDLLNKPAPFDVWLQGTLEHVAGNHAIISDSTGKAKVTGWDFSNVSKGDHYCVIGVVAMESNNMPEVKAAKFINIGSEHQRSWETEVKEAQLFLQGKVIPKIK